MILFLLAFLPFLDSCLLAQNINKEEDYSLEERHNTASTLRTNTTVYTPQLTMDLTSEEAEKALEKLIFDKTKSTDESIEKSIVTSTIAHGISTDGDLSARANRSAKFREDFIKPNTASSNVTEIDKPEDKANEWWMLPEYWNLPKIKAPEAWEMIEEYEIVHAFDSKDNPIIICIMDTGININHPKLKTHLWSTILNNKTIHGYNLYDDNNNIEDIDILKHGTCCTEFASAVVGHEKDLSQDVQFMIYKNKTYNSGDDPDIMSDFIKCIKLVLKHNAHIVNCSNGDYLSRKISIDTLDNMYDDNEIFTETLCRANKAGIIIITSAGNDGQNNDNHHHIPSNLGAIYDNIIAVAATTKNDFLWSNSNHGGNSVHLGAPGESVTATCHESDEYLLQDGTSVAAPQVTGATALVKKLLPQVVTPWQIIQRLCIATDPINYNDNRRIANGRLNIANALKEENKSSLNSTPPPSVEPTSCAHSYKSYDSLR